MKLIGLMGQIQYRQAMREIFEKHGVQIYSEIEIAGHTAETIRDFGFWVTDGDAPVYSILLFAVVSKEKADEVMGDIACYSDGCDPKYPPRAFQIDVEKMV
jgi:hypothetical protein